MKERGYPTCGQPAGMSRLCNFCASLLSSGLPIAHFGSLGRSSFLPLHMSAWHEWRWRGWGCSDGWDSRQYPRDTTHSERAWNSSDGRCSEEIPSNAPDSIPPTTDGQIQAAPELSRPVEHQVAEGDPVATSRPDCIADLEEAHRKALELFHHGDDLSTPETSPRQHAVPPAPPSSCPLPALSLVVL